MPKKIIYCSEKSIKFHENRHFYNKNKTTLIDNGYSDKSFYPSKFQRLNFRRKNRIKDTDIVLGFAGRYTSEKNIRSLLIGFSKVLKNYDNVYLCMVGKDINIRNKELMNDINYLNIKRRLFIMNEQKSLLKFYNGIDLLILTSHSESFPNVVAEAMLCSTPVLSSNVGSTKKIIGNCGFIMKENNYLSISKNLNKCIVFFNTKQREWKSLKKKSHLKIKKNFSIEKMANTYFKIWNF